VFGRRIEFEWLCQSEFDYEFHWPISVEPFAHNKALWEAVQTVVQRFTRPEPILAGSIAHNLLVAWCANPKEPTPQAVPPDPFSLCDPDLPTSPAETTHTSHEETTSESLSEYLHSSYREFALISIPELSTAEQERLQRAIADLDDCCRTAGDSTVPRVLLARAMLFNKRFLDAAVHFQRAHKEAVIFNSGTRDDGTERLVNHQWDLLFSAAMAYHYGGGVQDAINTLKSSEPTLFGYHWWIGKWYSEVGDYTQAAHYLRMEADVLSPPQSWHLSTVIALGEIASESTNSAKFVGLLRDRSPKEYLVVTGLIKEHLPFFSSLSEDSQDRLIHAEYLIHGECPPELKDANRRSAVAEFGSILETELTSSIFKPFKQLVTSDPKLLAQARKDMNAFDFEYFRFVARNYSLGLGAMVTVLDNSRHSVVPTDCTFLNFWSARFPQIVNSFKDINLVRNNRNLAAHGVTKTFDHATVTAVSVACKNALAALFAPGPS
jgi:hypothetical protein